MRETTRSSLKWVAAGALGLALLAGPSAAQNNESIKLRVPVQLKKMLADTFSVSCGIYGEGLLGSKDSEHQKIVPLLEVVWVIFALFEPWERELWAVA